MIFEEPIREKGSIRNNAWRSDDCYSCFIDYPDAHYCSTQSGSKKYNSEDFGWCCGDYDPEFEHLKPPECYSIPEVGYKCSDDLLLAHRENNSKFEDEYYYNYLRYSRCLDKG